MKADVMGKNKTKKGTVSLPSQFNELVRPDLIKRAVLSIQSHKAQPYGAKPDAGLRASADISRRRRKYKGSYGYGISRIPRKILSRRGTRFSWSGAVAPGTVGGRRAHPPKAEKILDKKINKKENRKAIRSALAASVIKELVVKRGHEVPETYPIILEDITEGIAKTKEAKKLLEDLGLKKELGRSSRKKVRAGKGKGRGRKYKKKRGPLLVVSADCPLMKSASNIPGVDVVKIKEINAELLAPGTDIGRMTLYTESAIKKLDQEKLFYDRLRINKEKAPKGKPKKKKVKKKISKNKEKSTDK